MFSNRIANSAKFLQMPVESQLLYFHMILRADDDGVVESYPLLRLLGIAPDGFKVLLARGFIDQLNEDQVVLINDWLEHNTIRADRKVDSIYKHLLPSGTKTIDPKPRKDVKDNSKRLGGQSTVSVSKVRLGKVKSGKVNKTISKEIEAKPEMPTEGYGNKTINAIISTLKTKADLPGLDGSIKGNRQHAKHLVREITNVYKKKGVDSPTDDDIVRGFSLLVDAALADDFHAANTTSTKYLYNNFYKIFSSVGKNKPRITKIS